MQETILLVDGSEVESKLAFYGLDKEKLTEVARRAVAASRDSTNNFPSNAPGQLSYMYGTQALRDLFLGEDWLLDRKDGIESILNKGKQIKIVFQNVDIACCETIEPKPRSEKGAGSERSCNANQGLLFKYLPRFVQASDEEAVVTHFLMVSNINGEVCVELSIPIVSNRTFSAYIERIFISQGSLDQVNVDLGDNVSSEDSIEVIVQRK